MKFTTVMMRANFRHAEQQLDVTTDIAALLRDLANKIESGEINKFEQILNAEGERIGMIQIRKRGGGPDVE
jgi:hypothetical protein